MKINIVILLLVTVISGCALGPLRAPNLDNKSDDELLAIVQGLDYNPVIPWPKSNERHLLEDTAIKKLQFSKHRPPETEQKIISALFQLLDEGEHHRQTIYETLSTYPNRAVEILPKLVAEWDKKRNSAFVIKDFLMDSLLLLSSREHPNAQPIFTNIIFDADPMAKHPSMKSRALRGMAQTGVTKETLKQTEKMLTDTSPITQAAAAKFIWAFNGEVERPINTLIEIAAQANKGGTIHMYLSLPTMFWMGSDVRQAAQLLKKMVLSEDGYCPKQFEKLVELKESQRACQEMAAVVLWRAAPNQREFLKQFFRSGIQDYPVYSTLGAFYNMDSEANEMIPILKEAYQEKVYLKTSDYQRVKLALLLERLTGTPYAETSSPAADSARKSLENAWGENPTSWVNQ